MCVIQFDIREFAEILAVAASTKVDSFDKAIEELSNDLEILIKANAQAYHLQYKEKYMPHDIKEVIRTARGIPVTPRTRITAVKTFNMLQYNCITNDGHNTSDYTVPKNAMLRFYWLLTESMLELSASMFERLTQEKSV